MNNIELKLVAENEELKLKYLESLSKNIELQQQNIDLLKQIGKYQLYEIAPMEKAKDVINELAKDYEKIYPIASRCGVFAKSDIQPLLNQGANHQDIAVSIYQAIVNQTIAGLSQGRKIKGNVAFLGGPLTFSSELRKRFIDTLKLEDVLVPKNGEVFVAYGASLNAEETCLTVNELKDRVIKYDNSEHRKVKKTLNALFNSVGTNDRSIFESDKLSK